MGDGLLCRLLRDLGLNCFVEDKYAQTSYAAGYEKADFDKADMALAFEVMEHLNHPKKELSLLFQQKPDTVIVSTIPYAGQGKDWWYLAPDTGQHIFFYSDKALKWIGEKFGYQAYRRGEYILYRKSFSKWDKRVINFLLGYKFTPFLRALLQLKKPVGIMADYNKQYEALQRRNKRDINE